MTKIQWTDLTHNPLTVASGGHYCEKVSQGCKNCFAEKMNLSSYYKWANLQPYQARPDGYPEMALNAAMLQKWTRMRKANKIFVGSMTDIFGEWVKRADILRLIGAMSVSPKQTFQILTKRPIIAFDTIVEWCSIMACDKLPKNIWLGVSTEDQENFDKRLHWLARAQAQIKFLSLEPLLGPIDLSDCLSCIDWIIIGGESGPNARPLKIEWVEDILRQCSAADIPAFVKQLGSHWAKEVGAKHSKGGAPDEWPEDVRVRMFPGEVW